VQAEEAIGDGSDQPTWHPSMEQSAGELKAWLAIPQPTLRMSGVSSHSHQIHSGADATPVWESEKKEAER